MRKIERLDKYLLWSVCLAILTVVGVNFATSYGHISAEGAAYGEPGFERYLMPVGIDGMLMALGLANVFAARFNRNHWLLRAALGFGVAGTVWVNGQYGARWGMTGGELAVWSPLALFITVEAGLFMFRVVADVMASQTQVTPKRGRPAGSKNMKPRVMPSREGIYNQDDPSALPVIRGTVDRVDPFRDLPGAA